MESAPAATRWERAYQAFETPDEELAKFLGRLRELGADRWDRQSRVLEVCSGRGAGLRAWSAIGFRDVIGVDYSHALVAGHRGPGRCVLGDVRAIPLDSGSRDIVAVQGGLHHLFSFVDVDRALGEMCRILTPGGRIIIIEPWLTPFLSVVHAVSERPLARRFWQKLEAFNTMREEERETYERWLNAPDEILAIIRRHVVPQLLRRRWGKLIVSGSAIGSDARR
jgi:ubiquinone/menaquinone biosynthesis C-methylase UbiE